MEKIPLWHETKSPLEPLEQAAYLDAMFDALAGLYAGLVAMEEAAARLEANEAHRAALALADAG